MIDDLRHRIGAGTAGLLGDDLERPLAHPAGRHQVGQAAQVGDRSSRQVAAAPGFRRTRADGQCDGLDREVGDLTGGQVHGSVDVIVTDLFAPPRRVPDHGQGKRVGRTSEALGRLQHLAQRRLVSPRGLLPHPLADPSQPPEGLLHHGQLVFEHVSMFAASTDNASRNESRLTGQSPR